MFSIEKITNLHRAFVDAQIAESWAGPYVVSRGVLHDTRTHAGFVALESGTVIGYILFHVAADACEITVLESMTEGRGAGRALMDAVIRYAKECACRRVWLITTNDNTHALRFYQRCGFALRAVHMDALEQARKLKPQIPLTGCEGIPLQHEFELELML